MRRKSTAANKQLVRRYDEDVVSAGHVDVLADFIDADYAEVQEQKRCPLGIEPTGKRVEIGAVNIDRVVNGKIVEHGGAANMLEPLLRIGAIQIVQKPAGQ